jgi:hypothetical protein
MEPPSSPPKITLLGVDAQSTPKQPLGGMNSSKVIGRKNGHSSKMLIYAKPPNGLINATDERGQRAPSLPCGNTYTMHGLFTTTQSMHMMQKQRTLTLKPGPNFESYDSTNVAMKPWPCTATIFLTTPRRLLTQPT